MRLHISATTPVTPSCARFSRTSGQTLMGTAMMIRSASGAAAREVCDLAKVGLCRVGIVDRDPVALTAEESSDPATHPTFTANDQSAQRVSLIHGIALNGLFFDGLADEEGREVAAQILVEAEQTARIREALIDLGLDLEVSQRNPCGLFELADLASQLEPLTDQVQDAPVEGLDIAAVLIQQRPRCIGR